MSARKGYLHPPSNYTTTMTCPTNNQAGNSFFVDSLINARSDGGSYYQSNGVYLPPASDYSYGAGGSCFPGIGKRNEPSTQSVIPSTAPYGQGMETWLETSRSCRVDQPRGQHMAQCSFSPSIKEESAYCLYEPDKCSKGATVDDISYSSAAPCPVTGSTFPVPGYFRLSQAYNASSRVYSDAQPSTNHFTPQQNARMDSQPSQPAQPAAVEPEHRGESTEDAPVQAPCAPAGDEEDSRLSLESSSSPEPNEKCSTECPDKSIKGEEESTHNIRYIYIYI